MDSGVTKSNLAADVVKYEFISGCGPFFCSRDDNQDAAEILSSVDAHNPIILFGPSGVGKSHIVRSFLTDFSAAKNKTMEIITASDLISQIIANLDSPQKIIDAHSHVDIFIIDDAFVLFGKPNTQITLFNIIWEMVNNSKTVIIIADDLNGLDEAFLESFKRFNKGIFVEMKYPATGVKIAYSEYQANKLGLRCSAEKIQSIASNAKTLSQINACLLVLQTMEE